MSKEELEGTFTRVTVQTKNGEAVFNKAIFQYDEHGRLAIYEEGKLVSVFNDWESVAIKDYNEEDETRVAEAILEDWKIRGE